MRQPNRRRIYVSQYGYFWSMSQSEWRRFLADGAAGKTTNLDDYGKEIKTKPAAWHEVYTPLDWTSDDFKSEAQR